VGIVSRPQKLTLVEIRTVNPIPVPGRFNESTGYVAPDGFEAHLIDGFVRFEVPERYRNGKDCGPATVVVPLANVAFMVVAQ
jgi:hypothetical protein